MTEDAGRKGQYAVLQAYFREHPTAAQIIVDIGADQRKGSNSWRLIKEGWRGVLVEPVPRKVAKLQAEFKGDFAVIMAAVSDFCGKGKLYLSEKDSYHSLCADWLPEHHTGKTLTVDVITLAKLLQTCRVPKRFGILDVDTEGNDPKVITPLLNETDWRPDVIIVELIDDKLFVALLNGGYKFHRKFGIDSMWVYQEPKVG